MDRQRRNVTIPNRDASNEEKESKSYGLEYAQYIEFEWITGNDYTSRKKKFEELEALRNNEVDIDTRLTCHLTGSSRPWFQSSLTW